MSDKGIFRHLIIILAYQKHYIAVFADRLTCFRFALS